MATTKASQQNGRNVIEATIDPPSVAKTKTPRFGDVNDLVSLEASLAKAQETIEKQRVHIGKLERELVSLLRVSEEEIAWLRTYVETRDRSVDLRKEDLRRAKGFNGYSFGTHYETDSISPGNVIDVTRNWMKLAVQGANDFADRLQAKAAQAVRVQAMVGGALTNEKVGHGG